jgi:hypothetical protein
MGRALGSDKERSFQAGPAGPALQDQRVLMLLSYLVNTFAQLQLFRQNNFVQLNLV